MKKPTQNDVLKAAESVLGQMENLSALVQAFKGEAPAPATTSKGSRSKASKASNDSKGSGGRQPSAEQVKIRQEIIKRLTKGSLVYFTIAEATEALNADRIQTRNAINYLEQQGAVIRYGEKLAEGRGQRELIYKAADPEAIKAVA